MANITYNNGGIYLNNQIISNSFGPTPVIVVDNCKISVDENIGVHYTITEALQGTALRLFKIPKQFADGDEWFTYGEYAVYLCTSRKIDGHSLRWKSKTTFGELVLQIVTRQNIENLDPNLSYTLFLRHVDNNILDEVHENYINISCVWDIKNAQFLDQFDVPTGFRTPRVLLDSSYTSGFIDESSNALVRVDTEDGIMVERFVPLLVLFYMGDHIISLKYENLYDHQLIAIRQLDQNPYNAWILAKWMDYPGLHDYIQHYNLTNAYSDYTFHEKRFTSALTDRYYEKYYNMPIVIYKNGIENHIYARNNYDLNAFIMKGLETLYNMARNRHIRNRAVAEFVRF
jgi:hypothetical protein